MPKERSLDPENWNAFRAQAHAALDQAISHLQHRSDAPVWRQTPAPVRAALQAALPLEGTDPEVLVARICRDFLPHDIGNTHPRFYGWVHGSGTADAILPEIFAAVMNANLGGRDHVANLVEKQVIQWCREMVDFPETAGGLVVSGTSMATVLAVKAAREKIGGLALRQTGLAGTRALVGYASVEAHSCIARAFDILGLGKAALRAIPSDADFRMDIAALEAAIAADLNAGLQPFCLIGTAGAVNVGAIDPLDRLADIAARTGMWFHVDGAFGAMGVLSPAIRPLLAGIERADSLAFDFHKWMHVTYDAGFVLVRQAEDLRHAFSERPAYLEGAERGLAAGNPWFCEYGPELSRGFRALKIWYHMARFGLTRIGEKVADNCAQTQHLAALVRDHAALDLLAPVALNIVCFRFDPGSMDEAALDALNGEIVIALQERGLAAPSTTRIRGQLAIRVNLTNHRTKLADLDALVADVLRIGCEITGG
ncbi:MAG: cytochrome D ubiquinol oxidase subunit I [Rhodobacteraceae bacterium]|nr:cytochrome D ubiquinol oxidase subunit I [Paracoccaceae bacterium]